VKDLEHNSRSTSQQSTVAMCCYQCYASTQHAAKLNTIKHFGNNINMPNQFALYTQLITLHPTGNLFNAA